MATTNSYNATEETLRDDLRLWKIRAATEMNPALVKNNPYAGRPSMTLAWRAWHQGFEAGFRQYPQTGEIAGAFLEGYRHGDKTARDMAAKAKFEESRRGVR